MDWGGLIPAIATPFCDDGRIDFPELESHVSRIIACPGVVGVAALGHAGEITSLTAGERIEIVRCLRGVVPQGQILIAGIEGHSGELLADAARGVVSAGADALLVLPPFDVQPLRHLSKVPEAVRAVFEVVDREVGAPLVVFQYGEASGCSYSVQALAAVADLPSVVAIKAGTRHITPYVELYEALHDKVAVLAAADSPVLMAMLVHGAAGALVGIGTVGTRQWAELVSAALQGETSRAVGKFRDFGLPLTTAIFHNQQSGSPISATACTKEALFQIGELRSSFVRPPVLRPDAERKVEIREALRRTGLISA